MCVHTITPFLVEKVCLLIQLIHRDCTTFSILILCDGIVDVYFILAYTVDTIEALTVGWDPESITYLKYLSDRGMGTRDPAKIAVVGNFVQNVRKDFKIRFTNLGGVQIKDKTPPELSLVKKENANGNINLDLDVSEDTVKVEVLVDDILYDTVHSPDFKRISIDTSRFTAGKHIIRLFAYDRFLNHKEIQVEW